MYGIGHVASQNKIVRPNASLYYTPSKEPLILAAFTRRCFDAFPASIGITLGIRLTLSIPTGGWITWFIDFITARYLG
jgi:hypothetical protein